MTHRSIRIDGFPVVKDSLSTLRDIASIFDLYSRRSARMDVGDFQGVVKLCFQAGQKGPRCKAREKPAKGGVLRRYVVARRSSATPQMGLFQRSVLM